MLTKIVDLTEAQDHFMELVASITSGTEIILTKDNIPIARLMPAVSTSLPRKAGLHLGIIQTRDDFDESLSENFWMGDT